MPQNSNLDFLPSTQIQHIQNENYHMLGQIPENRGCLSVSPLLWPMCLAWIKLSEYLRKPTTRESKYLSCLVQRVVVMVKWFYTYWMLQMPKAESCPFSQPHCSKELLPQFQNQRFSSMFSLRHLQMHPQVLQLPFSRHPSFSFFQSRPLSPSAGLTQ